MDNEEKLILEELKRHLSLPDKILLYLFKNYTYRIYIKGTKKGFDWNY